MRWSTSFGLPAVRPQPRWTGGRSGTPRGGCPRNTQPWRVRKPPTERSPRVEATSDPGNSTPGLLLAHRRNLLPLVGAALPACRERIPGFTGSKRGSSLSGGTRGSAQRIAQHPESGAECLRLLLQAHPGTAPGTRAFCSRETAETTARCSYGGRGEPAAVANGWRARAGHRPPVRHGNAAHGGIAVAGAGSRFRLPADHGAARQEGKGRGVTSPLERLGAVNRHGLLPGQDLVKREKAHIAE